MPIWAYAAFLLFAGAGLAFIGRRARPLGWPLWVFVGLCAGTAAIGALASRAEGDFVTRGHIPKPVKADGYISSATCRSCHTGEHASWHRSYHRTMAQVVSPATVLAPFRGETFDYNHERFRFTREGDGFFVEVTTRLANGGTHSSGPMRVVLSTGSHHYQVYWVASQVETQPFEIVIYWNIAEQRWIPKTDTLLTPPGRHGSPGSWNVHCIRCHSVNGKPEFQDGKYASQVTEYGIACESCHGPGEAHVRKHRNPVVRYLDRADEERDPTIVNPAKLSAKASSQVCGRCHSSYWVDMERYVLSGFAYRPGDDLDREVVMHDLDKPRPGDEDYIKGMTWGDGTSRVGGDEYNAHMKSPCFTAGELKCVSCHSLHDSDPNDQLAKGMETNQACLQCHGGAFAADAEERTVVARIEEHTHHPASSPGSLCYNCHMPNTTWALSTAMRAHRIDVPDIAQSARTGRPNACNLCHLDKTLAWSAAKLTEWYGAPGVELPDDQQRVAASVLWLLKGDAVQRAIAAWHMAWPPALAASGSDWQPAVLAQVLDDPYSQVRFVAGKSLAKLPGFTDFAFDFIAKPDERARAGGEALRVWAARGGKPHARNEAVLLRGPGQLDEVMVQRIARERDDTPVDLPE